MLKQNLRWALVAASVVFAAATVARGETSSPPIYLPDTPYWRFLFAPPVPAAHGPEGEVRLTAELGRLEQTGDLAGAAGVRVEIARLLYDESDLLAARATLLPARQQLIRLGDVAGLARCLSLAHLIALADRHRTASDDPFSLVLGEPEPGEMPPLLAAEIHDELGPAARLPAPLASWVALFDAYQVSAEDGAAAVASWRQLAEADGAPPGVRGLAALAAAHGSSAAKEVGDLLARARQQLRLAQLSRGEAQADLVEGAKRYEAGDVTAARESTARARGFYERQRAWHGAVAADLIRAAGEWKAGQKQAALAAAASAERLSSSHLAVERIDPKTVWNLSRGQVQHLLEAARELPALLDPSTATGGGLGAPARAFYRWARRTGHPYLELAACRALEGSLMADGQWKEGVLYDLAAQDLLDRLVVQVPLRQRMREAAHLDYQVLAATGLASDPVASESFFDFVSQLQHWVEIIIPLLKREFSISAEDLRGIRQEFARLKRVAADVDRHRTHALALVSEGKPAAAIGELDRFYAGLPKVLGRLAQVPLRESAGEPGGAGVSFPTAAELAYRHELEKAAILRDERPLRLVVDRLATNLATGGDQGVADWWLPVTLGGLASRDTSTARQPAAGWVGHGGWEATVGRAIATASQALDGRGSLRTRRWGRIVTALARSGLQEALALKLLGGTPEKAAKEESRIFRALYASQLAMSLGGTGDFIPLGGDATGDDLRALFNGTGQQSMWTLITGYFGVFDWVRSLQGLPVSRLHTDAAVQQSFSDFIEFFGFFNADPFDDDDDKADGKFNFSQWGRSYPALLLMLSGDRKAADSFAVLLRSAQADLDRASRSSVVPLLLGQEAQSLLEARRNLAVNLALYDMAAGRYDAAVPQLRRLLGGAAGRAGLEAYQFHYALALCYRRLREPEQEVRSLAAAIAASRGLRRVMPTHNLALRMENVRQFLMEEYLGALSRRGQAREMAAALWDYRRSSLVPTAIVRGGDQAISAELETLKDLYGGLSTLAPDEMPVTTAGLAKQLQLFGLAASLPEGADPMLDGADTAASALIDELGAGRNSPLVWPIGQPVVAADELLLTYFAGTQGVYLVTLDSRGRAREHYRRVDSAHLEELCRSFLDGLAEPGAANGPAGAELYDLLLGYLPEMAGKRHLRFLPDGPLQLVPFQALRSSPGAPYLVERFTVSYASGVQDRGDPAGAPGEPGGLLVIADPQGNLSAANSEVAAIEKSSTAAVRSLSGPAATIAALRQELPRAGLVHFSTHAKRKERQPNFSFLGLAGAERLYSLDLGGLDFRGKRVFLGACETLLGKTVVGDDVYGIAQAFLGAGASSVVATLWSIDDRASATFDGIFYENLRGGGRSEAEALASTDRCLISGGAGPDLAAPSYWAAFNPLAPLRFTTASAPAAAGEPAQASGNGDPTTEAMLKQAVDRINAQVSELTVLRQRLKSAQERIDELQKESDDTSGSLREAVATQISFDEMRRKLLELAGVTGATASISVDVISAGRKPLPGVRVTLTDLDARGDGASTREARADEKGDVTFTALPIGHRYQIEAATGHEASQERPAPAEAGATILLRDTRVEVTVPDQGSEASPPQGQGPAGAATPPGR